MVRTFKIVTGPTIDILEIGTRARNALVREGLTVIPDLIKLSANSLRFLPNVGEVTISEIQRALKREGYELKQ